jgi:hypothetical protein
MRKLSLLILIFLGYSIQPIVAQFKRIDTTMKIGKSGYKVVCNNKNDDKNYITITPVGFANSARDVSFEVKGKIKSAEIDDLNNDLFPDLVLYVYPPGEKEKGTVIGVASEKNESFTGIMFPDIVDDPKLRTGYQGYDQFMLMEGTLMRKFPVYTVDSVGAKPTGMYRQVQYRVVPGERGSLKFKVARSYEFAKQ